MNKTLFGACVALCTIGSFATPALAQVGVSVSVGEPGFYGQINIGDVPSPRVIYAQPIVVEHVRVSQDPVYLHVPPGHAKHWEKHCAEYNACGRAVYFVEDDWYQNVYVPHHQGRGNGNSDHGDGHGNGNGNGNSHGHGNSKGHGNH